MTYLPQLENHCIILMDSLNKLDHIVLKIQSF